jgi:hypothetical protein
VARFDGRGVDHTATHGDRRPRVVGCNPMTLMAAFVSALSMGIRARAMVGKKRPPKRAAALPAWRCLDRRSNAARQAGSRARTCRRSQPRNRHVHGVSLSGFD